MKREKKKMKRDRKKNIKRKRKQNMKRDRKNMKRNRKQNIKRDRKQNTKRERNQQKKSWEQKHNNVTYIFICFEEEARQYQTTRAEQQGNKHAKRQATPRITQSCRS